MSKDDSLNNKNSVYKILGVLITLVIVVLGSKYYESYKDKQEKYNYILDNLENVESYSTILGYISQIDGFKDLNEYVDEFIYNYGVYKYEHKSYKESYDLLIDIEDYKDSSDYVYELMSKISLEGRYKVDNCDTCYVIVRDNNVYLIKADMMFTEMDWYRNFMCDIEDNLCIVTNLSTIASAEYIEFNKDEIWYYTEMYYIDYVEKSLLKKISDDTTFPEIKKYYEPTIGMTDIEVINSNWGEPDEIITKEYTSFILEQWVYDEYGDIYFEDGNVKRITE